MSQVEAYCKDEYKDHTVYGALARREKHESRRRVLEDLSAKEYEHYSFWSRYADGYTPSVSKLLVSAVIVLRSLFGLTFTLMLLETHDKRS